MTVIVNHLSLATTKLRTSSNGKAVGCGTGFFYRRNGELFIVSNWHVLSGRHPDTGQPLNEAAPAEALEFDLSDYSTGKLQRNSYKIDLFEKDGSARWAQHKKGQQVDVGVLHVPKDIAVEQINSAELSNSVLPIRIGQDVFILGYPMGIEAQFGFPIWKRGSIASEPNFHLQEDEVILIDTATREGMSGAPVVAVSHDPFRTEDGGVKTGNAAKLVGVYSGRIGSNEHNQIQLGRCWKAALIDEIIDHDITATYELI
jgi:Trypsin-like peptidase domain